MESQISAPDAARRERLTAIAFAVGAMLALTLMDAALKSLVERYAPIEIVFMRSIVALILMLGYVLTGPGLARLRTRRRPALLARSVLNLATLALFVMALKRMPLADATAVAFAAPFLITGFSALLLGERVGIHRWGAILVGIIGVMIIARPGPGLLSSGAPFALAAAVMYALAIISSRAVSRTENNTAIIIYNLIGMVVISGLILPFQWTSPELRDIPLFIFIGVTGAIGQILVTQAYRLAPAAVLAPFDYTALIWAVGLGYIFWGDLPSQRVFLGIAVLVASGLYILHRETRRRRGHSQGV
ncbi:MAG: DMT family transporter [Alphaproteobacteria bacterium]